MTLKNYIFVFLMGYFSFSCTQGNDNQSLPYFTALEGKIVLADSTQVGIGSLISGLEVPWEITWGPDDWIWFTEQKGQVSKVDPKTGEKKILLRIPDVFHKRSTGLLGMALHPDFDHHPHVFLLYTFLKDTDQVASKLVRYTAEDDTLQDPQMLLEIPGSTGHNGSRLTFSSDGNLLIATGDATKAQNAQAIQSPSGKILRINPDGTIPDDNPFPESPVWSWGHRNMQGLVVSSDGKIFTSEHGDAIGDEVNLIEKKGNYGWPDVEGMIDESAEKNYAEDSVITAPLREWTPTIAPAGIDYYGSNHIPAWKNALLLTTLKEQSLLVLKLNQSEDAVLSEKRYLQKKFGRFRDICISPSGEIFISTSNRDWNPGPGFPKKDDDKIIRIFKVDDAGLLGEQKLMWEKAPDLSKPTPVEELSSSGKVMYQRYCASCHKARGEGVAGVFPSLTGSAQVIGSKEDLIQLLLKGSSDSKTTRDLEPDQRMPAFGFLTDKELADVLSFVRSSFGNQADNISAEEVMDQRKR